ncbi:MAG: aerotolerance regulator BatA [Omnitrophica bacterium RBG_13_46_9]|nr:MAG: aerotolerance regulator BatA [Omnitrophica bacterium RBG_13_46_9]
MILKDGWALLFFPVIIFFVYFFIKKDLSSGIRFSSRELVKSPKRTLRLAAARNLFYLRLAALTLFLFALARPQSVSEETKIYTEGIDVVLAIDCSGSMRAEDFIISGIRQNRLEAVKIVVENFIRGRKGDRIGMIAFAARAYTVCPMTLDYDWLVENLERVKIGSIEDGTAVGSAIISSVNRLKDTEGKSKVIILLTDGINNAGRISPLTAAEAAKALGIKIYTIGAGTKGLAPYPMRTPWGETVYENVKIEIDEDTLKGIADETGGRYFRATDTESLKEIYKEIDVLEKTKVEEIGFRRYKELFPKFVIFGFIFLMLEIILSGTVLRKLP